MDVTVSLLGNAVAMALSAVGLAQAGLPLQPTIWAALNNAPPSFTVFYDPDAPRTARRWQMLHAKQYAATVLIRDGGVTLDGSYQRALIVTALAKSGGEMETRYVLPYQPDGFQIAVFPMIVVAQHRCAYASSAITENLWHTLPREMDRYGMVTLSFAPALPSQETVCNSDVTG